MWSLKRRCGNGCDDVDQDDGGDGGERAQVTQVMGSTGLSRRATRVTRDIWSMVEKKDRKEGNLDEKEKTWWYDDRHIMIISWQRWARVLSFYKMYSLFILNHHTLEKMCDVTPVADEPMDRGGGKRKIWQHFGRPKTQRATLLINIAKCTTGPRVEFILQDHSSQILNILQFQNLD